MSCVAPVLISDSDCCILNIMMDGSELYPEGFHPVVPSLKLNYRDLAPELRRRDVSNVKYLFTDYGVSSRFDDPSAPRLVLGTECQDRTVPELSRTIPYDPFPVDVYTLGNVYREALLEVSTTSLPLSISDHSPRHISILRF